jgi:sugar/nucleoside kinase (ribokinase family)
MNLDILTMGPLLVEIIRTEKGLPLGESGYFAGPFPSGDTPIFIDAAAKMGRKCGFVGVVGDDDFGRCATERLSHDGVDISFVRTAPGKSTAVTFVAYFHDGSRKFLYHVRDAAAGELNPEDIDPFYLEGLKWFHITGFSLSGSSSTKAAFEKALDLLPKTTKVSFDPNIRPEQLSTDEVRALCGRAISRADLILPSANEATMFTGAKDEETGCLQWRDMGKTVVRKRGSEGCRIYDSDGVTDIPTFEVEEIDPTGAGDAFSAALVSMLLENLTIREAAQFASAVGAMSVRRVGPMEGIPTRDEVEAFISKNQQTIEVQS